MLNSVSLPKDLGLDWRLGAEWFESCLLDHDVYSNYGNWNYAAGIGNDPREGRKFNIVKQVRAKRNIIVSRDTKGRVFSVNMFLIITIISLVSCDVT